MTEEEKLKRAFKIYEEAHYSKESIPEDEIDEFESYNISDEQMLEWDNQHAFECYNKILTKLDRKVFDEDDVPYLDIFISKMKKTKENLLIAIELLKRLYRDGIFIKFFNKFNFARSMFSDTLIENRDFNKNLEENPYYFNEEFAGLLPYFYHINELEMYNELFHMIIKALMLYGNNYIYMVKTLIKFTTKFNDEEHYKSLIDVLYCCKKNAIIPYYKKDIDNYYALRSYNNLIAVIGKNIYDKSYISSLETIIIKMNRTKENFVMLIDILKRLYNEGIFVKFFEKISYTRYGFSSLFIATRELNERIEDNPYYFNEEFAGLLPYLYHINEIDMYNELFHMIIEGLKTKDNPYQYIVKMLLDFTKEKNDEKNHKLLLEVLDYCKEDADSIDNLIKWED